MDDSLEVKQEYLRTQILDKGYDADNFMAFLQEKKGEDGVDLSNWNISELKDAVTEFTSIYKPIESEKEETKATSAFQSGELSIFNKVKAIYNNPQKVHRVSNNNEFEEFIKNLKLS